MPPTASQVWFVYALCEPGTERVRYIGSSKNPFMRLKQHGGLCGHSESVNAWIRSLGADPIVRVLSKHDTEVDARFSEQEEILSAERVGVRLLNRAHGAQRFGARRRYRFSGLGSRLAELRASNKVTISHLSDATGINRQTIYDLEAKKRPGISAEKAVALARFFDVSVEWLVTGEERAAQKASAA